MNDKTVELIEQLAEKLGTTSEYIFSTLISQAPLEGIILLVQNLIIWVLAYGTYKAHRYFSEEYEGWSRYEELEWPRGLMIFLGFLSCISLIYSFTTFSELIAAFFNPEYWALMEIRNFLR